MQLKLHCSENETVNVGYIVEIIDDSGPQFFHGRLGARYKIAHINDTTCVYISHFKKIYGDTREYPSISFYKWQIKITYDKEQITWQS